jgi:hypothetical protein
MGALRKLFGPSKEEVWRKLRSEIGADFVKGSLWRGDKVVAKVDQWTITLDTYTVSTGKSSATYTRLRAPYVNHDGFRFTVYRKGFSSELGKLLGMQGIQVGDPAFDNDFIIKGNNVTLVRSLFANPKIRQLIQAQPNIYLTVKDDEGWFSKSFPKGVDELYFQAGGVIKEVERLKALYELFAEMLHYLCHLGSAYENDPQIAL